MCDPCLHTCGTGLSWGRSLGKVHASRCPVVFAKQPMERWGLSTQPMFMTNYYSCPAAGLVISVSRQHGLMAHHPNDEAE